jgi:hypothetical protein
MTTITPVISKEVQDWLDARGLKPNVDGTVRMVKVVRSDYRSDYSSATYYLPGTTVQASDYNDRPVCGGGLHFAHTRREAEKIRYNNGGYGGRTVVCDVDLESMVVVTNGQYPGEKVKARFAHVLYEGDETDFRIEEVDGDPKVTKEG